MADDIDDLLDECETKFCDSSSKPRQKPPSKTKSSSKKATRNEDRLKRFTASLYRCKLLLSFVYFIDLLRTALNPYFFYSSQAKNVERDELHDMIEECMDDGPDIPELDKVKTNRLMDYNIIKLT